MKEIGKRKKSLHCILQMKKGCFNMMSECLWELQFFLEQSTLNSFVARTKGVTTIHSINNTIKT